MSIKGASIGANFGFAPFIVIFYVSFRVDGKRMSNGPIESLNGRLKRLIGDANGFTHFERFRNRRLFVVIDIKLSYSC